MDTQMRTAVLLSGQPRQVAKTWDSFAEHFFKNLPNPDVYIYTSENYPVPQQFFDCFKPKKYIVEPQFRHGKIEAILRNIGYYCHDHMNSYIQQIYGLKKVWELKDGEYDLIVRVRPDLVYFRDITLEMMNLDHLTTVGVEWAVGKQDQMDKFFQVYDWLLVDGEKYLTPERLMKYGCDGYFCDTIAAVYLLEACGLKRFELGFPVEFPSPYYFFQIEHLQHAYGNTELQDYLTKNKIPLLWERGRKYHENVRASN